MTHKPERIAIYMAFYEGGAETVTINLVQGFLDRGYGVDLVLQQVNDATVHRLPKNARIVNLQASKAIYSLPSLVRYLRREQPEALLSVITYTNLVALVAQRIAGFTGRVVVVEHNVFSPWNRQLPKMIRWFLPNLVAYCYPWAQKVIAVSHGVADDLCKATSLSRKKVQVIHNPVITNQLRAKVQIPMNHPWYEPGQPPVLLAVGRLSPEKDFQTLIKAFARVHRSRPVRLLILGEGKMRMELQALITSLGLGEDISLPGFVDNPYHYMAHSAMLILSSLWEGLPTVLVEALYCNIPIVATDCLSGPREILCDGKYGRLVPIANPIVLAKAIEATLDSNNSPAPEESWRSFDLDGVLDQYLSSLWGV